MSWITKNLTLDLLAIAIDGLNKVFNRINQEGEASAVDPATAHPADLPAEVEPAAPADPADPAPAPVEEPAAAPAPEVDHESLLTEAQNLCRTIAQKGGVEWITGTLLPHFNTQSLTDVPAERLPELITMATERTESIDQAAG